MHIERKTSMAQSKRLLTPIRELWTKNPQTGNVVERHLWIKNPHFNSEILLGNWDSCGSKERELGNFKLEKSGSWKVSA